MKKPLLLLTIIITAICFSASGQTTSSSDPYQNRVIAKHYTTQELQNAELYAPEKFKFIKYFYMHSFQITDNGCSNCQPYNRELIDVSEYNHLRQPNERYRYFDERFGFTITLLSQRELDLMILRNGVELVNEANGGK